MEIRRIDHNTYDVFTGKQWSTWTRVRQARGNTYRMLGEQLPKPALKWLHEILAPNMPINKAQSLEITLDNCAVLVRQ